MTTEKTGVAFRVLTTISEHQQPDERDVALLRTYLPTHRELSPDQMACVVIQEMYESLKQKRAANVNL